MKKKQKPLYLNRAISMIVMVGYSAFLILMLIMDWYLIREYQYENRRVEQAALNSYIDKTRSYMDRIDRQLYDIYANDENFQALQKKEEPVDEFGHAYELKETLNKRMLAEENMSGFFVFYDNRQKSWYYTNLAKVRAEQTAEIKEILLRHLENDGKMRSWISLTVDGDTNLATYYEKDRVAVFGIHSMKNMEQELRESMGKEISVILLDNGIALENKELSKELGLSETVQSYSDSFQMKKGKYQLYGRRIPNMDLWVCTAYPVNIWSVMTVQQLFLLILTGISVFAVGVMYRFVRREVVRPLHQLTDTMNTIRRGGSREVPRMDARFYEIQEVNDTLGEMVRELEKQKLLVYEEIIEKQKAQMQYLQLQLKPHFYLNGLKTLNALAIENQTGKMQELILNLSAHLRYLLQAERELVPLRMELEFVENYVSMQKHITGRPVNCSIVRDGEADSWLVPVLAVHTFVENSVKYARLGGSSIPLEIQVSASLLAAEEGRFLDLIIQDNGQGYPDEILEEINGDTAVGTRCVGINNIKRRCQLLYGERAEYSFANCDGAMSELIIPERKQEDECFDCR
ncbi:sensor histidine kinase [Murimonas intestini]|uniref:HAMP domain-containing protein n=1 Tax=Murimonas intestini TaxID=1337051 RepID=A0AB73T768_9FIRM|nr:histidine kinase [Murimonas intestini]MCR1841291.1 histidine kinase [Murimonas intestini]MCR1866209.1 histidine kinase [Murimonas intestini]MCR1882674.1 histidine kinase [Murimonas intestini]